MGKLNLSKKKSIAQTLFGNKSNKSSDDFTLSAPDILTFRHDGHIGCTPCGKLDIRNIPIEWYLFFEKSSLLQNQSPASAIRSCIDIQPKKVASDPLPSLVPSQKPQPPKRPMRKLGQTM